MDNHPQLGMLPPTIRIDNPSALIAATGPLIGRTPFRELVVWAGPPDSPDGPELLACPIALLEHEQAMADLVEQLALIRPEHVLIVAWEDAADEDNLVGLSGCRVVGELVWHLTQVGISVTQALTTNGRVWWSHICSGHGPEHDCPEVATALDETIVLAVRAELVAAGFSLAGPFAAPDPARSAAVAQLLDAAGCQPPTKSLEPWRDEEIAWLTALWRRHSTPAGAGCCTAPVIARALSALADVRVRDTVMFRLGLWGPRCRGDMSSLAPLLEQILASCPETHRAPPATILAIVYWLGGHSDPARGLLLLAQQTDPGYNLARLATLLVDSDLSPEIWRSGLIGLTEQECRTGRQDPGNRRTRAKRVVHLRRLAG